MTIVEVLWWGADLMGNAENTVSTVVESVILHLQNVYPDVISREGWDLSGGMLFKAVLLRSSGESSQY